MSFVAYDIGFLVLFTLFVVKFLHKRRNNLKRQGLMYLYRTRVGINFIEKFSSKYYRILKPMQYVIVACGYLLMGFMLWMLARIVYLYSTSDKFITLTKIPPVLPLVPYLPSIFKVDFLPPFYFTYWILIIAVVALVHEFAHGIFARLNKIKVHSTGFGFLGPFLAAFVEPDERQMQKAKKFPQLAILAAGTFSNILVMLAFMIIIVIFFMMFFVPAGVNFNTYATAAVNVSAITSINGVALNQLSTLNNSIATITAGNLSFFAPGDSVQKAIASKVPYVIMYEDAPAIRAKLKWPITEFGEKKVTSPEQLKEAISNSLPNQIVTITTREDGHDGSYDIKLGERNGKAYLGIGLVEPNNGKIGTFVYKAVSTFKKPFVYYEPRLLGDFAEFIYDLFWWMILINMSVALVNMLPVGMFDGGRFFYLTIWGITGSEKAARNSFKIATWLILASLVWLMVRWALVYY